MLEIEADQESIRPGAVETRSPWNGMDIPAFRHYPRTGKGIVALILRDLPA
jgi:hypothetical protein